MILTDKSMPAKLVVSQYTKILRGIFNYFKPALFTSLCRPYKETNRRCLIVHYTVYSNISKVGNYSQGWPKSPFLIAITPRCREGATPFPGLLHFTLDPYLRMLSVKQGGIKYHSGSWTLFWYHIQLSDIVIHGLEDLRKNFYDWFLNCIFQNRNYGIEYYNRHMTITMECQMRITLCKNGLLGEFNIRRK